MSASIDINGAPANLARFMDGALESVLQETAAALKVGRAHVCVTMIGALVVRLADGHEKETADFLEALALRLRNGDQCAELDQRRIDRTAGILFARDRG